jgi:hypothetical protein
MRYNSSKVFTAGIGEHSVEETGILMSAFIDSFTSLTRWLCMQDAGQKTSEKVRCE